VLKCVCVYLIYGYSLTTHQTYTPCLGIGGGSGRSSITDSNLVPSNNNPGIDQVPQDLTPRPQQALTPPPTPPNSPTDDRPVLIGLSQEERERVTCHTCGWWIDWCQCVWERCPHCSMLECVCDSFWNNPIEYTFN